MTNSILTNTKKMLGLAEDDTSFDLDVVMYINMALTQLHDLGVGPELGFAIQDKTSTWSELLGNTKIFNDVKTFIYMSVRLMFDPPTTSFGIAAMEKQLERQGWMINVRRENAISILEPVHPEEIVLDGGNP